MKSVLLAALLSAATLLAPAAQADWYDRGHQVNSYHFGATGRRDFVSVGWGHRGGYYSHGWNNRFDRRWDRGWRAGYRQGRWDNSWSRRWDTRWNGGDFVGGLVLGSILTAPAVNTHTVIREVPVVRRSREVVYVNPQPTVITRSSPVIRSGPARPAIQQSAPRRRLLRDLSGDCFEISITSTGDELRQQIDPSNCNY